MAAPWLYRLHFQGATCLDNTGVRRNLNRWEGKLFLEGGTLLLEGQHLLHREGRSGVRLTLSRGEGAWPLSMALLPGTKARLRSPTMQIPGPATASRAKSPPPPQSPHRDQEQQAGEVSDRERVSEQDVASWVSNDSDDEAFPDPPNRSASCVSLNSTKTR